MIVRAAFTISLVWTAMGRGQETPSPSSTAAGVQSAPSAPDAASATPAKSEAVSSAAGKANRPPATPPALRPYKIAILVRRLPPERFSPAFMAELSNRIRALADRYLGAAWELTIEPMPASIHIGRPPDPPAMKALQRGFDKFLLLQIGDSLSDWKGGLAEIPVQAREYDFEFDSWGPTARESYSADERFGLRTFELLHRQFRVRAEVGAADPDGKVPVTVLGLALQPRDSDYPLAVPGTPIKVYRDFISRDKKITRTEIPWTFLIYRQPEEGGMLARCDVLSGLRNPLTMRTRRRIQMPGIGAGASESSATELRFVTGQDLLPVTGYEVAMRAQDSKATVNLGNTDHRGRIVIDRALLGGFAGPANSVRTVQILLVAGQSVLASFPIVPGERDFRQVNVRIDPLFTEVNGRIMSLQDDVVDTVARRAVLQRKLDFYTKKNDIERAKQIAEQFNALPDQAAFKKRLEEIKDWTMAQAKAQNRQILGSPINRLFLQTDKNVIENNFQKEKVEVTEQITVIEKRRPGEEPQTPDPSKEKPPEPPDQAPKGDPKTGAP